MNYAVDVFIIIFLFALFGLIHSYLASNNFKRILKARLNEYIAFYRLSYNILAVLLFVFFLDIMPKPDVVIYDLQYPYDLLVLIPQFLSVLGILWAFRYFNVSETIGISQIIRFYNNEYETEELDEHLTLRIRGPYKFVRHPLYFFIIVFLLFRAAMDLFSLIIFICVAGYFYVGSKYEEKKLIERFGSQYEKYKKEVPPLIPLKIF